MTSKTFFIRAYFCRFGIEVLGISSDGDSRLLRGMKNNLKFPENLFFDTELSSYIDPNDICYIQDPIHIGTKLRNRILKPSIILLMGNKQVSVSHLKILINSAQKDIHGLVYSDICPDDRMNFKSLEKVMDQRVINALRKHVITCTIKYINICKQVTSCCLDALMTPIERIYSIWSAMFFLRIWKNWIQSKYSDDGLIFNLNENFISNNAFSCVEINAYTLLHLILKLRNAGKPELFLPNLFDSQPCERTFRQMRSMGTINWTKINFTLQDLLHLIARVELQNSIVLDKLADIGIEFPRFQHFTNRSAAPVICLPSNEEIISTIKKAQENAMQEAATFGMEVDSIDILSCQLRMRELRTRNSSENEGNSSDEEIDHLFNYNSLNMRDYNESNSKKHESNTFIEICEADGSTKIIRKSSIVWLLSESSQKLSSDRLKRVQSTPLQLALQPASKRQKLAQFSILSDESLIFRSEVLRIGNWCYFLGPKSKQSSAGTSSQVSQSCIDDVLIGALMGFQYRLESTQKRKPYFSDYVLINEINDSKSHSKDECVQVQADWYTFDAVGVLSRCGIHYLDVGFYLATTSAPILTECENSNMKKISLHGDFSAVKNYLNSLLNP